MAKPGDWLEVSSSPPDKKILDFRWRGCSEDDLRRWFHFPPSNCFFPHEYDLPAQAAAGPEI